MTVDDNANVDSTSEVEGDDNRKKGNNSQAKDGNIISETSAQENDIKAPGETSEKESLNVKARKLFKRATCALGAYGQIPVKQPPAEPEESEDDTDDEEVEKLIQQLKTRKGALSFPDIDLAKNSYLSKSNTEPSDDFDVSTFLGKEPEKTEKIGHPSPSDDDIDAICKDFRKSQSRYKPSGLIKTLEWDKVFNDIKKRPIPNVLPSVGGFEQIEKGTRTVKHQNLKVVARQEQSEKGTRIMQLQDLPRADSSTKTYCKICQRDVQTLVMYERGSLTYFSAFLCACIFPVFLLCAWVPFFFSNFLDVTHACPKCGTILGRFKRI